ncbi:MAG: hypothetical protein LBJ31_10210 [Treponema sp.]|jgi:hypothetical protein|nr:hypothetical protein [Treponema sp.]
MEEIVKIFNLIIEILNEKSSLADLFHLYNFEDLNNRGKIYINKSVYKINHFSYRANNSNEFSIEIIYYIINNKIIIHEIYYTINKNYYLNFVNIISKKYNLKSKINNYQNSWKNYIIESFDDNFNICVSYAISDDDYFDFINTVNLCIYKIGNCNGVKKLIHTNRDTTAIIYYTDTEKILKIKRLYLIYIRPILIFMPNLLIFLVLKCIEFVKTKCHCA